MRRSSFAAALTFIALGAVFAFAIHVTNTSFNVNRAGLIVMIAGAADLAIRALIGDDPLLSPGAAQVAAVIEPIGEPVLDAFGRPITYTPAVGVPRRTVGLRTVATRGRRPR